ncbi:MAG: DUF2971 domain-containing protein [Candidatus Helarchaeota archaeon]
MEISDFLKENKPKNDLFHYTDLKGLMGIIENKSIWMTRVSCLNDSLEYVLALRLAKDILNEFEVNEKYNPEKINTLRFEIEYITKLNIFVSSFTENGDQLSQWRAYGNSSGTYSLGFHGQRLLEEAENQELILAKCEYDHEKQREMITSLIREHLMLKDFNTRELVESKDNPRTIMRISDTYFWKNLGSLAPILKHEGFHEEKEWRIITKSAKSSKNVLYRKGRSYIIPYFNFKFANPKELFKSIRIGPTPYPEISKDTLWMFLQKHGTSKTIKIEQTNIPYRNW